MPRLQRVISGNVFYDNFDQAVLNKRWTVSPSLSSRYSLQERPGFLRIKHADSPTYIITDMPQLHKAMFEIKNEYKPVVSIDIGGIVVFKTIDDRVELVEFYDPILDQTKNYLYVRLYKNGDIYDGYGSQDGIVWELIGTARVEDALKIGLVLNGEDNSLTQPLDVYYAAMYRDRHIYVENLQEGMKAQLYNSENELISEYTILENESIARFDMFSLPIPFRGYIKVYSQSNALLEQTESQDIYPGDEFQYIMDISIKFQRRVFELQTRPDGTVVPVSKFVDDVDFILDEIVNIGNMEGSYIEGIIVVRNLEDKDITNLQAYIDFFPNSYATHIVQLSRDEMGEPANYQDSVIVSVPANSSTFFWIKISTTDVQSLSKFDKFKYKLCFKNT